MTQQYYEHHVFVCENVRDESSNRKSCGNCGSKNLRDYMKKRCKEEGLKKVRINSSGCLDRCELGAVMVIYPSGDWYHYENEHDIEKIIAQHLKDGKKAEELSLKVDQKRL